MGELRAYVLPAGALDATLADDPGRPERVLALVGATLPVPAPPPALGPLFARVPGTPVLRADDPAPEDLDRLLAARPAPPGREAATWRLVEALLAALAVRVVRTEGPRPAGLTPLGLRLPGGTEHVAGRWTRPTDLPTDPAAEPLGEASTGLGDADDAVDVVVVWSARTR